MKQFFIILCAILTAFWIADVFIQHRNEQREFEKLRSETEALENQTKAIRERTKTLEDMKASVIAEVQRRNRRWHPERYPQDPYDLCFPTYNFPATVSTQPQK